jgi:peroxiredoxin
VRDALKLAAVIALVVAGAFGFVMLEEQKGYGLVPGSPAPAFRLQALGGTSVDLASLRGKVVVLNFWATWCPPCVQEMPSLERLYRALGASGLAVVGVAVDDSEADVRAFVARSGITFKVLRDPGATVAAGSYRATGYPETFVLDRQGRILKVFVGPAEWDTADALGYFRGLLAASPVVGSPGR